MSTASGIICNIFSEHYSSIIGKNMTSLLGVVVTPTSNSLEIYKNTLSSCKSTAAGIAGCLGQGMQVQCIIHVILCDRSDGQ